MVQFCENGSIYKRRLSDPAHIFFTDDIAVLNGKTKQTIPSGLKKYLSTQTKGEVISSVVLTISETEIE